MLSVCKLSPVLLFATLWTVAHQAPLSMGFSRQEYWSGLPFPSPGDLPHPGIEPASPAFLLHCRQILYCWTIGEAHNSKKYHILKLPIWLYGSQHLYIMWQRLEDTFFFLNGFFKKYFWKGFTGSLIERLESKKLLCHKDEMIFYNSLIWWWTFWLLKLSKYLFPG